jgi:hypothetical protein
MFLLPFSSYSQKVIFVSQIYLDQNHEVGPPNEDISIPKLFAFLQGVSLFAVTERQIL